MDSQNKIGWTPTHFIFIKTNKILALTDHFCPFWYRCYYPHQSSDSVSPVCKKNLHWKWQINLFFCLYSTQVFKIYRCTSQKQQPVIRHIKKSKPFTNAVIPLQGIWKIDVNLLQGFSFWKSHCCLVSWTKFDGKVFIKTRKYWWKFYFAIGH